MLELFDLLKETIIRTAMAHHLLHSSDVAFRIALLATSPAP